MSPLASLWWPSSSDEQGLRFSSGCILSQNKKIHPAWASSGVYQAVLFTSTPISEVSFEVDMFAYITNLVLVYKHNIN